MMTMTNEEVDKSSKRRLQIFGETLEVSSMKNKNDFASYFDYANKPLNKKQKKFLHAAFAVAVVHFAVHERLLMS